jgi:hypothetical protein
MDTDRSQDAPQRRRLEALVQRLSDAQLAQALPDGWTVAAVLAHLAFWDNRAAVLVERWRRSGVGPSEADVDVINDALKPQWLALAPRVAAEGAVQAARAADAALDALDQAFLQQIVAANAINVSRALHRAEHLDQIEEALPR